VLAVFADRSFLGSDTTPHVPLLAPFWGVGPEPEDDPATGRYDRLAETGRSFLRLAPLEDCDVAVFPQSWEAAQEDTAAVERARRLERACRQAGKPLVVFYWADATDPVPLDAVVFRTSLYRSSRSPREFAQPAWSEDFLQRYRGGSLEPRPKRARPLVGFCGYTAYRPPRAPTLLGRARYAAGTRRRELGRRLAGRPDERAVRVRAVQALERDRRVETNFVVRDEFWGGALGDPALVRRARGEYVESMLGSDYVLCARGRGNFSYRLYETLCCGRIPVFVDTDCVLPLDFAIDWRDYCVWVEEPALDRIGERVVAFHERLSDGEFQELQRACRRFWETHLSPQGFFAHLHLHF
jgi:hypothetical protein